MIELSDDKEVDTQIASNTIQGIHPQCCGSEENTVKLTWLN